MERPTRRDALDRPRIEAAAFEIIDRVGVEAFSMRTLASELHIEPMSLYHWYPSKAHLLEALMEQILARLTVEFDGTLAERVAVAARSLRAAICSHPGFASYALRHRFNSRRGLEVLNGVLAIFHDADVTPATAAALFRFMVHWLMGFCLDETAGFAKGPSAIDPPPPEVVARDFPYVAALEPFNRPEHFDALFELGLARVQLAVRMATDSPSRPDVR